MALVSNEAARPSSILGPHGPHIFGHSRANFPARTCSCYSAVVPRWEHCLEYEHQLRREAIREENFSIQAALWHAFEDQQHRLTHWVQLLTIANSQQAGPNEEVSNLRKEVAELRKAVSQRSRSPRGKGASKRALPALSQLAAKRRKKQRCFFEFYVSSGYITPTNFRSFDQIIKIKMRTVSISRRLRGTGSVFLSKKESVQCRIATEFIAASAAARP